ncbi:hypothetical protein ONZ45_g13653 [Pleurotus djamor]|nr:hypothetical protein ONZ45_g13653 [Pleurotus djamor]
MIPVVPKLPPELLTMVIIQLGSPCRNALHPLLTVSHAMYDMVVPLIYETLVIAYFDGGDPSITYGACTQVPPTHLRRLYESLAHNPALGEYASTFIANPASLTTDINNIISYFPYLQRISLSSTGPDDAVLESIPESGTLTHLKIPFAMPMTMKKLLCSCTNSLRFLSLSGHIRDLADFLPSSANMNCLDTFEVIRTRNLDAIFGVAPIQHLSVVDLKVDSIMRPEAVLSNLLTLQVHRIYSRQGLSSLSPYLKNLRLLYLSITMDESNEVTSTPYVLFSSH